MVLIQDPLNTTPFSFYTDYLGSFISGRILRSCRVLLSTDMVLKKKSIGLITLIILFGLGESLICHWVNLLKISHRNFGVELVACPSPLVLIKYLFLRSGSLSERTWCQKRTLYCIFCTLNKTAGIRSILEIRVSKITRRVASMRCAKRPVSDYSSINPFPVNSNDDLISKWLNIDPYWIYVFRLLAC